MSHVYKEINKNKKYCNKEVYEEVADRLNVTPTLVEEIFLAQSEFTAKVVKRGAFESVTFPYLGKMKARLRQLGKILNNPSKKKYEATAISNRSQDQTSGN